MAMRSTLLGSIAVCLLLLSVAAISNVPGADAANSGGSGTEEERQSRATLIEWYSSRIAKKREAGGAAGNGPSRDDDAFYAKDDTEDINEVLPGSPHCEQGASGCEGSRASYDRSGVEGERYALENVVREEVREFHAHRRNRLERWNSLLRHMQNDHEGDGARGVARTFNPKFEGADDTDVVLVASVVLLVIASVALGFIIANPKKVRPG